MTLDSMHRILDIQESAMEDGEFLRLYENSREANTRFIALWAALPKAQQLVIDDYLQHAALLYHRLMELALDKK